MPDQGSAVALPAASMRPSARTIRAEASSRRLGQILLAAIVLVYLGTLWLGSTGRDSP